VTACWQLALDPLDALTGIHWQTYQTSHLPFVELKFCVLLHLLQLSAALTMSCLTF
jgi:hypothetical protein